MSEPVKSPALSSEARQEARAPQGGATLDVEAVRRDFPALALAPYGKPLVYLDSAASAQKPEVVIETEARCYREFYANVHRGVHYLSAKATVAYEDARRKTARFIGARNPNEIIFVRGTTEGINLVASSYGRRHVGAGDEVLITTMEHHSNIVPWQLLCEEKGATLKVAPINDRGEVELDELEKLMGQRTRLFATVHVSNALGTINPVREMIALAHARGIPVLLDGAQAVPHMPVDVAELDCEFYVFSGHKAFGPSGIGALYGKLELLQEMPPYQGGGEMIRTVSFEKTEYADPPARFEAGTPNIAGAIALGTTVDYLEAIGMDAVWAHEENLLGYGTALLENQPGLRLIGTAREKVGVLSFVMDGVHPHDIGTILDREGIAVRTGHHCAQPVMDRFGVPATVRASLALYNIREELDQLAAALAKVRELFA
ncbi:MAG: cysteine desulfurase [Acidobacteriota bacterium]|nr:cysteine desulfurase [Acidobacteriota bacterium]